LYRFFCHSQSAKLVNQQFFTFCVCAHAGSGARFSSNDGLSVLRLTVAAQASGYRHKYASTPIANVNGIGLYMTTAVKTLLKYLYGNTCISIAVIKPLDLCVTAVVETLLRYQCSYISVFDGNCA
jgi:hypothetical protein